MVRINMFLKIILKTFAKYEHIVKLNGIKGPVRVHVLYLEALHIIEMKGLSFGT